MHYYTAKCYSICLPFFIFYFKVWVAGRVHTFAQWVWFVITLCILAHYYEMECRERMCSPTKLHDIGLAAIWQFELGGGGEGGGRDLTMQGDKPCFSSVTDCDDVTGCIASYFVLSDLCLVFRYSWPSYTRLVRLPVIELSKQRGPQSCSGKQNVW